MPEVDGIKVFIGIVAAALSTIGYLPYLRDTWNGKTKPHVYSWFIFGSVTFIVFAIQISGGAGAGAWPTFMAALLSLAIFILSVRRGNKNITKLDTVFFVLALTALAAWLIADQPAISVTLLVLTGLLGLVPTIRKSWNEPFTETLVSYMINTFRHGLSFFALVQYSYITWLFPVTWTIANAGIVIYLLVRRRQVVKHKQEEDPWL